MRLLPLVLLLACAPPDAADTGDTSVVDTGDPPPPRPAGTDDARFLQVGTFNIDWLNDAYGQDPVPRNRADYGMIASLLEEIDVDVLGMQEIEGTGAMDLLELPEPWRYACGRTGWSQNPTLLWRSDLVEVANVREIHLPSNEFPEKDPLVARVTSVAGDLAFTVVVVHLKAETDAGSARTRQQQVKELRDVVDRTIPGDEVPPYSDHIVVVGDFNDTFDGIVDGVDTLQPLEDDAGFWFASRDTTSFTNLHYRNVIDHVMVPTSLLDRYVEKGASGYHVVEHDRMEPYRSYTDGWGGQPNLSSHRPAYVYLWNGLE